jgi:DHA2 family multidrug resistance protein
MSRSLQLDPSASTPGVNKWVVAFTVLFGTFMAVMDINVVNVALPHMMGSFSEDLSSITWIATAYSIAEIIMVTMAGWLSTLLGRKRLYLFSFGLFTLGSILCGTAVDFHQMIFYRVLQGLGGGALIPVSQAILRETFPPEEQGMAMAVYGMGVVLAPAIGPILGGWLTDHYGWPWIFFINVPVSAVGMLMIAAFVHDPEYLRRGVRKIDWVGIALLAVGLTTMQIVLERGQGENWFESRMIIAGSLVCVATMLVLIYWEMKVDEPVINLRILRDIPLTLGCTMGLVFGIALFGTSFILPQFTQNLLGYPAFEAGLVLMPRALMMLLFMPVVGRLYNNIDSRLLVLIGTAAICWSYYDLGRLSLEAGFWNLVPAMIAMGIGMPAMFVTISTVSLASIPRAKMTDATSLYTLARRIGGNIGYALVATMVARSQQIHHVHLVGHINPFNTAYQHYSRLAAKVLSQQGLNTEAVHHAIYALVNRVVNLQATMLAYNDVSWFFGILFLGTVPFVLMLPGHSVSISPRGVRQGNVKNRRRSSEKSHISG